MVDGATMAGFGPKQAWLAVRDRDPDAVAAALGLRDLGEVPWRAGVDLAYLSDDRLVLTPPLPGARAARWVLAAGRWLLRADVDVDVAQLSATLTTEVQLFATHRVHEWHRWVRAVDGILVRAFGYLGERGEVTEWRGDPDHVEVDVGLPAVPPDDGSEILVGERDVIRMAAAWSVDPTALDGGPAPGPLRAAAVP